MIVETEKRRRICKVKKQSHFKTCMLKLNRRNCTRFSFQVDINFLCKFNQKLTLRFFFNCRKAIKTFFLGKLTAIANETKKMVCINDEHRNR